MCFPAVAFARLPHLRMASLRGYKRKSGAVLLFLFLVCLVNLFFSYNWLVFSLVRRQLATKIIPKLNYSSTDVNISIGSKDILNVTNGQIRYINNLHLLKVSENPGETTRKPTTLKPSVDMVNDYYPFIDFKFVFPDISPTVATTSEIFMLVLVNSGAKGDKFRNHRQTVRETWGNQSNCEQREALGDERLKGLTWLLVFVVGKAGTGTNDDELNMAEARQHNDMLIGNIKDNYFNNIIKLYMGLMWASKFDIKYTLKTDDDVYVRIPRVLEYLVNAKFPRPFYGGWNKGKREVRHEIGVRWAISWKYFAETHFPKYNAGAFFVLSSDLLDRLFNYVNIRKPFHLDDSYVAVAMRDLGIECTGIVSFLLRHDMWKFILKAKDCEILNLAAIGHWLRPESIRFLHNRFKTMACGSKDFKC